MYSTYFIRNRSCFSTSYVFDDRISGWSRCGKIVLYVFLIFHILIPILEMIRNGWDSSAEHDISVSHGKLARLCCLLAFLASCFVGTLLCGGITVHRRSIGMHNQPWDKSGQGKISLPLTVTKLPQASVWKREVSETRESNHTTTLSLAWLVTWYSPINGIVTLTRWDSFIDDSCCQSYKSPCHSYATMHRCTSGLKEKPQMDAWFCSIVELWQWRCCHIFHSILSVIALATSECDQKILG